MSLNSVGKRFRVWFRRYTYPLILGTLAETLSAVIVYFFASNYILSAIVATLSGNVVFYLALAYLDLRQRRSLDNKITLKGVFKVARNLIIEFGPAEYLDTYLFRPILLTVCPMFISPYFLGAFTGSVLAEIIYIILVVFSYESRRKMFRD